MNTIPAVIGDPIMTHASSLRKLARLTVILTLLLCAAIVPLRHTAPALAQDGSGTHTVQAGENLFRIALRYGYTVEYLASVNGIADPTTIYVGQVIVIPDPNAPAVQPAVDPAPVVVDPAPVAVTTTGPVYHTVQAGETLAAVGRLYGLGWTDIAAANGLTNPNQIFAGQQLLIPGSSSPGAAAVAPAVETAPAPAPEVVVAAPAASGQRSHVVVAGEHLASIATAYGVTWPAIAAVNNITDPNHIYAGMVLVIPEPGTAADAYTQPNAWTPPAVAAPTITSGKQIVVDLSDQRVYAYENGQLVRNVLVSTGMWGTPTVIGDYNIYLKYDSQLMTGPGYYLPGVPWVMYFYKGYSLHGTYWHNNFGTPMSHGCVNMPTPEALWLFNWAPMGTPVHVQA